MNPLKCYLLFLEVNGLRNSPIQVLNDLWNSPIHVLNDLRHSPIHVLNNLRNSSTQVLMISEIHPHRSVMILEIHPHRSLMILNIRQHKFVIKYVYMFMSLYNPSEGRQNYLIIHALSCIKIWCSRFLFQFLQKKMVWDQVPPNTKSCLD